jgi:nucleolar protein 9
MDPFASHVIRALLGLLCPSSRRSFHENSQGAVRSKKSASWKSKQGSLASVFTDMKGKSKEVMEHQVSPEFRAMSRTLVETVRNELGDNEVRALAADKVASPCLLVGSCIQGSGVCGTETLSDAP